MGAVLCWFHQDLRLGDNPVLDAALKSGHAVVPIYILDDVAPSEWSRSEGKIGDWKMGGASRWWLHHSLDDLARGLAHIGSRLILRSGDARRFIPEIAEAVHAHAVYTQERGEPWSKAQIRDISKNLKWRGCALHQENSANLTRPGDVLSKSGTRMKVFTPYKRNLLTLAEHGMRPLCPCPEHLPSPERWPHSEALDSLNLMPRSVDWSKGLSANWQVGETAALQRFNYFLETTAENYHIMRDKPSEIGTSRLSPHLHFGEISPIMIYHAVCERALERGMMSEGREKFLSEVIWREFSYELLDQFPHMPDAPMKTNFEKFPWAEDYGDNLNAWQNGQTGYPLIDAGMRELYETGWMHNHVRMITASFLTKHLLIPWQEGAKWFFDKLVDADLASNSAGWQWVVGCGADAVPYFRIFNPISQGTKFDAGAYTRKWCPELSQLDQKALFQPFDQPEMVLQRAGIMLGKTYPKPLIDHATARARALDAFKVIKSQ